jgi:hypothetical protein
VLWSTFTPRPLPRLTLAHATAPFTTSLHHLCLFRGESVLYPSICPSICTLVSRIEALGYAVDVHSFPNTDFQSFPRNFWGVAITITEDTLLFIVPLPHRCCLLTHSGVFFGEYEA